jgi:hypothetical protein
VNRRQTDFAATVTNPQQHVGTNRAEEDFGPRTLLGASLFAHVTKVHRVVPATGRIVECVGAFLRTAPEAPLHRRHLVAPH